MKSLISINDKFMDQIEKGMRFLTNIKYKDNVVFEYGLEYCNGRTIKEKIIDYLDSIDYISEKYILNK